MTATCSGAIWQIDRTSPAARHRTEAAANLLLVMAGLVPAIHVDFPEETWRTWTVRPLHDAELRRGQYDQERSAERGGS
jgi:hypothetical protein